MSRRRNPYTRDPRTAQAKAQGYPARSVFKLGEIDRRVALLKPGQSVLDLGAAPGSWSLYASQKVGGAGRVLAVDLEPIVQTFAPNVEVLQGDALALESEALARFAPYDLVLSDMAPKTSGSRVQDQARSLELFLRALAVARAFGASGSNFVGKIFMSSDFAEARRAVGGTYARVQVIRPAGTRRRSSEVFLVGTGKRA